MKSNLEKILTVGWKAMTNNLAEHNLKKKQTPEIRRLRTLKFLENQPDSRATEEVLMGHLISFGVGMQTLMTDIRSMITTGDIERIVYYKIKRSVIDRMPEEVQAGFIKPEVPEEKPRLLSEEELQNIANEIKTEDNSEE